MIKKSDERLISENLCHEVGEVGEVEDDVQQVGEKTILESHVPQSIY